jgi:cyclopropane-fatty-acyl-phospholipid synthase
VTTTTISREQFDVATRRVSQAGLDERITVLLQDYRDVEGEYDKLVSIEMLEAVGHQFFDTFFQKCNGLLKPQGAMSLQSITIRDQFYQQHLRSVDFIRKYIFPGGCLPSVATILQSTSRVSDLHLVDQVDIGEHYVLTLQRWREAFWSKIDEVRRLGYSERFIRMWDYYFCYCEGAFAEKQVSDVQMLFAKRLSPLRGIRFQTFGDAFVHDRENCLAYSTRAAQ